MTIRITQFISRAVPIAAAALFMNIGSVAASSPQGDIQQQMREVLTGSIATHAIPRSESRPADVVGPNSDLQAFARQLLLGPSISHVERASATNRKPQSAVPFESGRKLPTSEDFQSMVRRGLLGERGSSLGAS